jgi:hypothetical protein
VLIIDYLIASPLPLLNFWEFWYGIVELKDSVESWVVRFIRRLYITKFSFLVCLGIYFAWLSNPSSFAGNRLGPLALTSMLESLFLSLCPWEAVLAEDRRWNSWKLLIYNFWICKTLFRDGDLYTSFSFGDDYSIWLSRVPFAFWLLFSSGFYSETCTRLKLIRFLAISLSLGILRTWIVLCNFMFNSSISVLSLWMIASRTSTSDSKCSRTSLMLFRNSYLSSSKVFIRRSTLSSSRSFW